MIHTLKRSIPFILLLCSSVISQTPVGKIVMDGPVDPREYIVGPGDIFNVSIWTAIPLMFQVPVTPEGSVVIPTVAEVRIAGISLDSAKKIVLGEIRKKYITGPASFTLFTPRSFTVTVIGAVLNEGPIVVQSTQRVDGALQLANDQIVYREKNGITDRDTKGIEAMRKKLDASSIRSIIVKRKKGDIVNVDIEKYLATFNTSYNPLLLDGDVIIVQPRDLEKNYIGIYGGVTKEKEFEFIEGDSLSILIKMAGGLIPLADGESAMLYRTTPVGTQEQVSLNINDVLVGKTDYILRRGDRLSIPVKEILTYVGTVILEGEVKRPGSYPIIRDSTTLSQVIARAGGFTKYAALNASKIIRESGANTLRDIEYHNLRKGLTSTEDTTYLANEMLLKSGGELSSTDFVSLFEKNDRTKDVVLKNGDRIIIPQKINAVYVFGEVRNPGYVAFSSGKTIDYFISLAGGLTGSAETGDIRVVKASTKQWLLPGETTIEEGDYIWIPRTPFRSYSYYLSIYSQVFGIIATAMSLVLLVTR